VKAPLRLELLQRGRHRAPAARTLAQWATAALGRRAAGKEIALRLVGATAMRRLNRDYRGKDYATNVLSFPSTLPAPSTVPPAWPLGDIVICPEVLAREAREQRKPLRAHWAHLVVHGTLHLAGYDHEQEQDARRMERREIVVLRALGFANPYRMDAARRLGG
jgi:probable rRNA maturation factor